MSLLHWPSLIIYTLTEVLCVFADTHDSNVGHSLLFLQGLLPTPPSPIKTNYIASTRIGTRFAPTNFHSRFSPSCRTDSHQGSPYASPNGSICGHGRNIFPHPKSISEERQWLQGTLLCVYGNRTPSAVVLHCYNAMR